MRALNKEMTLIPPVNGFRQGHFLFYHSGVSPCKYSVSEVIAYSGISKNNMDILLLIIDDLVRMWRINIFAF